MRDVRKGKKRKEKYQESKLMLHEIDSLFQPRFFVTVTLSHFTLLLFIFRKTWNHSIDKSYHLSFPPSYLQRSNVSR